jgi:KaiC/GvpD/RAD55 family RecA-like ATPase
MLVNFRANEVPLMKHIHTGIRGLDELIGDGIPQSWIVLVKGPPGSGKTTFGLQFLCYGAKNDEHGIYLTIGEPISHVKKYIRFNLDLEDLAEEGKLILVDTKLIKLSDLSEILKEAIDKYKAQRIVIDSFTSLISLYKDDVTLRQEFSNFLDVIRKVETTTWMFIEEETTSIPYALSEYMADGVIALTYILQGNHRVRGLEIIKMRGSAHSEEIHLYRLEDEGIVVYPEEKVFEA